MIFPKVSVTRHPSKALFAGCCLAATILTGQPAIADGEFFQLDVSKSTQNGTFSIARGPFTFGASAVAYEDGETYGLSAIHQLPFGQNIATFSFGPSLGLVRDNGPDEGLQVGVKFVAERYIPTNFGSVYLLADINSIDRSWFVLSQIGLADPGINFELSRGQSDTYSETTFAVAKRLPNSPASLRIGYKFDAAEAFVGISINTF